MNKRDANQRSVEGKLSVGDLRAMIDKACEDDRMSRVNPIFTIQRACEIYRAAIASRDATEIPKGLRYDPYKNRDMPSRDSLIIRNILRDCA